MQSGVQLFPEAASDAAGRVDTLHIFLVLVGGSVSTLIALVILFLSLRYRRAKARSTPELTPATVKRLELAWTAIPFGVFMVLFVWGTKLYLEMRTPPADALPIWVTGKQWMWKLQHPTGQREINELHVPVDTDIVLTMTSEDVIHDFYVPAFRVKFDVLPGRYTKVWFRPTKTGRYHFFCAEYCGTKHSEMIGTVVVQEPTEYEAWLAGQPEALDPVTRGEELFESMRCGTCHPPGAGRRAPDLAGLFGRRVLLEGGRSVTADENYLRKSIMQPASQVVRGWEALMPTYEGQLDEADLAGLIAWMRSLGEDTGESTESNADESAPQEVER